MTIKALKFGLQQDKAYQVKVRKAKNLLQFFGIDASQGRVMLAYLKRWKDCR